MAVLESLIAVATAADPVDVDLLRYLRNTTAIFEV